MERVSAVLGSRNAHENEPNKVSIGPSELHAEGEYTGEEGRSDGSNGAHDRQGEGVDGSKDGLRWRDIVDAQLYTSCKSSATFERFNGHVTYQKPC